MLALRKPANPTLLRNFLSPFRAAAAARPFTFTSESEITPRDPSDERRVDVAGRSPESAVARRRGGDVFPSFFSDVLDPFSPSRSLSQVLNMMDSLMDGPMATASRGLGRRGWDAREGEDGLYMKIDMPGLGKEDVRVTVEQNTLVIKGEGGNEEGDEEGVRRYSSRIDLPGEMYKLEGIKAEMKNGVLKLFVPKFEEEERKDVVQVQID